MSEHPVSAPATPPELAAPGRRALVVSLVLSVLLEPFVVHKAHFGLDALPGFYLVFTAVTAGLAVLCCVVLRPVLRRGVER